MSRLSFSEVVGLDDAKRALLLAAIEPRLGGVLLRGDKGSAKTTLARGVAAILPGDAPFVELPLGAGEDRVLGALDLVDLLERGRPRLRPGLLAAAHGGVLYIDEINLLADHLVDALLDVAASGVNRVEREGLSEEHPARFVLIASMNPEEGELRPQLLDRFGLAVDVRAPADLASRVEAVRRQLAREVNSADSDGSPDADMRTVVARARAATATFDDEVMTFACAVSVGAGAEGLRADLTLVRAATALARLEGRDTATTDDVEHVAPLVLAHRRRRGPSDAPGISPEELEQLFDEVRGAHSPPVEPSEGRDGAGSPPNAAPGAQPPRTAPDAPVSDPATGSPNTDPSNSPDDLRLADLALPGGRAKRAPCSNASGRSAIASGTEGRSVRTVPAEERTGQRPDGPASALALATRRAVEEDPTARAQASDLRAVDRDQPVRSLVVFVVDTSTSMGQSQRLAAAKGAVVSLLSDAYRRRSRVALVVFHHDEAEIVLRPTSSTEIAASRLGELPGGGTTPVAAGLDTARTLVESAARLGDRTVVVLLTDGRATSGGPDPLVAAEQAARRTVAVADELVIVDTEIGYPRLGLAAMLAEAAGARLISIPELDGVDAGGVLAERLAEVLA